MGEARLPTDSVSRGEFEALKQAVAVLLAEVRALRGESDQRRQEKTARQIRYENRRALLRQLAAACGPVSWDAAESVRLILLGELPPPRGHERTVQRLLQDDETPRSQGRIWEAIRPAELTPLPPGGVSGGVQDIINHLQRARGD